MSKPRCVAVVGMISQLAISDVSVDPRHLCRRKERNLRRRSVLPIKWRTRISIADTLCLPGIKFRAAVRTIRGAFKRGYKGVKSDSYWYARRTNIYTNPWKTIRIYGVSRDLIRSLPTWHPVVCTSLY